MTLQKAIVRLVYGATIIVHFAHLKSFSLLYLGCCTLSQCSGQIATVALSISQKSKYPKLNRALFFCCLVKNRSPQLPARPIQIDLHMSIMQYLPCIFQTKAKIPNQKRLTHILIEQEKKSHIILNENTILHANTD